MSSFKKFKYAAVRIQKVINYKVKSSYGNICIIKKDFDNLVDIFNHLGEDGWEFCYSQDSDLVFKREII